MGSVPQPLLCVAHDRIGAGLTANQAGIGKLPLAVPLQQIDLGDPQGLAGAAVARNDMDREIVPGRGPTRGHNATGAVDENEVRLGPEADVREAGAEQILIAPVRGRVAPVEKASRGEQDRARAGGIDRAAGTMPATDPLEQFGYRSLMSS